jgi:hypothetical protein
MCLMIQMREYTSRRRNYWDDEGGSDVCLFVLGWLLTTNRPLSFWIYSLCVLIDVLFISSIFSGSFFFRLERVSLLLSLVRLNHQTTKPIRHVVCELSVACSERSTSHCISHNHSAIPMPFADHYPMSPMSFAERRSTLLEAYGMLSPRTCGIKRRGSPVPCMKGFWPHSGALMNRSLIMYHTSMPSASWLVRFD